MDQLLVDRFAIREVIENWVLWRDAGDWERFATVWHPDGRMMATWFQGSAKEFIELTRVGWEKGVRILHLVGGTSIDVNGARAIAQTKMSISQRADVDGHICDIVCTGRFYDFFEKVENQWLLLLRQGIYEKDRIDPVDPAVRIYLEPEIINRFPVGYRHLAYVQTKIGYKVKQDMPELTGHAIEDLYARGRKYLETGDL
jgi:hypothetical protein